MNAPQISPPWTVETFLVVLDFEGGGLSMCSLIGPLRVGLWAQRGQSCLDPFLVLLCTVAL